MKFKILILTLFNVFFALPLFSQQLPLSIRTVYIKSLLVDKNGQSTLIPADKSCSDFSIFDNTIVGKDCLTGKIFMTVKFINSRQTIYSNDGSWSKMFFGYDPRTPVYTSDGIQRLTDIVTIDYNKGVNNYNVTVENPNENNTVSVVIINFNF